jgi:hypothetical protein
MEPFEKLAIQSLFEKKLITDTNKLKRIEVWKFSLNAELKFLLYLSVLAFTTGMGL